MPTPRQEQATSKRRPKTGRGAADEAGSHARPGGSPLPQPAERDGETANGALTQEQRWAYGLGLFGIALGLTEVLAPRRLARTIGVPANYSSVIRVMGVREIASGIGILSQRSPATAVWSRVAGDALDLACLGAAFFSDRSQAARLVGATVAVAGAAAADLLTAQQLSRGMETRNGAIPLRVALLIDRSREALYRHWRDLSNLPSFMAHLERVEVQDDRHSHWVARGPAGSTVEWDAEITEDRANEWLAWRSTAGAAVGHAGSVRFESAPGERGTLVTVDMQYRPPFGTMGAAVAAWFGEDPSQQVKMDLRRFKQLMETGEVITTEGQPAGRSDSTSWKYDGAVRRHDTARKAQSERRDEIHTQRSILGTVEDP